MRRIQVILLTCRAYSAEPTFEGLVRALDDPAEWLTYWGDYHATRFRNLNQISDQNVAKLRLEWIFQTGIAGAFETVPLVAGGVMYFTTPDSVVIAVDARSGRQL